MSFFLKPALLLLNVLRYWQKFLFILILFLIPLLFTIYPISTSRNDQIAFSKQELMGVSYLKTLIPLATTLENIMIAPDPSFQQTLTEQIKNLKNINDQYGSKLKTDALYTKFIQSTSTLPTTLPSKTNPTFMQMYLSSLQAMANLTTLIYQSSNLILEPDADKYFVINLMNTSLANISKHSIQLQFNQFHPTPSSITISEQYTKDDAENLQENMKLIQEYASPDVYKQLLPYQKQTLSLLEQLSTMNKSLTTKQPLSSQIFLQQNNFLNSFYLTLATVLDHGLSARINSLANERNFYISIVITSILIIVYVFLAFYRNISSNIGEIKAFADNLSQGELTKHITLSTKDETADIAHAINQITDVFKSILLKNKEYASTLFHTTNLVDKSVKENSLAIQELTANVVEITSSASNTLSSAQKAAQSIEHFHEQTIDTTAKTIDISTLANQALSLAKSGNHEITTLIHKMNDMHKSIHTLHDTVYHLNNYSNDIHRIVTILKSIAKETNLLSLNASIEAARAGSSGAGFIIVATEVGRLANRSNSSATEIEKLIENLLADTTKVVNITNNSMSVVTTSLESVIQTEQSFHSIYNAIQTVDNEMKEIEIAMNDFADTSKKLVTYNKQIELEAEITAHASHEIAAFSEQQSSSIDEISSATENVAKLAQDIHHSLAQFHL